MLENDWSLLFSENDRATVITVVIMGITVRSCTLIVFQPVCYCGCHSCQQCHHLLRLSGFCHHRVDSGVFAVFTCGFPLPAQPSVASSTVSFFAICFDLHYCYDYVSFHLDAILPVVHQEAAVIMAACGLHAITGLRCHAAASWTASCPYSCCRPPLLDSLW